MLCGIFNLVKWQGEDYKYQSRITDAWRQIEFWLVGVFVFKTHVIFVTFLFSSREVIPFSLWHFLVSVDQTGFFTFGLV